MIKVDARGELCPIPVIKAKNALKEIEKDGVIQVVVDNEIAKENLEKMVFLYQDSYLIMMATLLFLWLYQAMKVQRS